MDYPSAGTVHRRHEDDRERWAFALRAPAAPLREFVRGYCWFEEERDPQPEHQHLPHRDVTLIVGLDGRLDVQGPDGSLEPIEPGQGFLGGLHTAPARTRSERVQRGLEVKLTPLGAHRLLAGVPMAEVSDRVLTLDALLGSAGREVGEQLAEACGPEAGFARLDAFLGERILAGRGSEALAWAWHRLEATRGRVRIGALAEQLGWSRRRMVREFRSGVGLAPKTTARVLRFDHAIERWKARPGISWSDLALDCGYADQAHLAREVRALSGQTASQLAARLLPASGAVEAA